MGRAPGAGGRLALPDLGMAVALVATLRPRPALPARRLGRVHRFARQELAEEHQLLPPPDGAGARVRDRDGDERPTPRGHGGVLRAAPGALAPSPPARRLRGRPGPALPSRGRSA